MLMRSMGEYRVNLPVYNGPLDLLLYLIRRDELDIYDIPIAAVTEQYVRYVELLKELDPNLAGDFLVMAATLMEIKTRMLLPAALAEDDQAAEAVDPRAELVRQLLEYKAFKDAAGELGEAGEARARRFGRPADRVKPDEQSFDLEDARVWDLLEAFTRLLEAIGQADRHEQIIHDDTPVELHAADIVDRLRRDGPMRFDQIFEGRRSRAEIIGLFLALLELVRLGTVRAAQARNLGRIQVFLNPEPPSADGTDAAGGIALQKEMGADDPPADRSAGG
jgi:segregation and condensation protein A